MNRTHIYNRTLTVSIRQHTSVLLSQRQIFSHEKTWMFSTLPSPFKVTHFWPALVMAEYSLFLWFVSSLSSAGYLNNKTVTHRKKGGENCVWWTLNISIYSFQRNHCKNICTSNILNTTLVYASSLLFLNYSFPVFSFSSFNFWNTRKKTSLLFYQNQTNNF